MSSPLKLYPRFQAQVDAFLEKAKARDLAIVVHEGFRSLEDSARTFEIGRAEGDKRPKVTRALPGESYHNYGLAIDVRFLVRYDVANKLIGGWDESHPWGLLGELGEAAGLNWAGRWKGKLQEKCHFEIKNIPSLAQLKIWLKDGGLSHVWKQLDLYYGGNGDGLKQAA